MNVVVAVVVVLFHVQLELPVEDGWAKFLGEGERPGEKQEIRPVAQWTVWA